MTSKSKSVTLTVTNGAYSAGDVVGGLVTIPMSMAGGGVVDDIIIFDGGDVGAEFDVYLFESAPSTIADNAAFTLSDADVVKLVGSWAGVDTYIDVGGAKYVSLAEFFVRASLSKPFTASVLYLFIVAVGTPTLVGTGSVSVKVLAHN